MPATLLNNNQMATILNEAVAEFTGKPAGELDLTGIVANAGDLGIIGSVDQFTKKLINVIMKKWYMDTEYRSGYNSPFFVDSAEYGAITEVISITVPDAQPASNWTDIVSGVTQLGLYTIYLPTVDVAVYGRTASWQIPIAIQEDQLKTAFDNEAELREFVAHVFLCVDNALVSHMEALDAANRNSFIASKISYANSVGATGIHVVNLVQEYVNNAGLGSTGMTAQEYLNNEDALTDGAMTIMEFSDRFKKMSSNYNTMGYKRFTPENRKVLQLLSKFDKALKYHMRSKTFHEDLVAIPNYDVVPYWQSENKADAAKIDVDIDVAGTKTEIEKDGIVGLLCDSYAIVHTLKQRDVVAKLFEPEHLTQYYNQFQDCYYNNLGMNGIVFTVEDVAAVTP